MATQCQSQRQQNSIKYYNYKPSEVKTKFCPFLLSTQTLNLKELEPELGAGGGGEWGTSASIHVPTEIYREKEQNTPTSSSKGPKSD